MIEDKRSVVTVRVVSVGNAGPAPSISGWMYGTTCDVRKKIKSIMDKYETLSLFQSDDESDKLLISTYTLYRSFITVRCVK